MQAQVFNVTPVGYGSYDTPEQAERKRNRGERPISFADGSLVEYVDVLDTEGQTRRMTLDQSINGSRLAPGTLADLDVLVLAKQFVTYARDGRESIRTRESYRVLAMRPVQAPAAEAA